MQADKLGRYLAAHLERVEACNDQEQFQSCPRGTMAELYALENLRKPLSVPGWARLWFDHDGGEIIAHASAYDGGAGDGYVFGNIFVEPGHRGKRIARQLQDARGAWLDQHGLSLIGAVAPGNSTSMAGCIASGFEILRIDAHDAVWVVRWAKGQGPNPR